MKDIFLSVGTARDVVWIVELGQSRSMTRFAFSGSKVPSLRVSKDFGLKGVSLDCDLSLF